MGTKKKRRKNRKKVIRRNLFLFVCFLVIAGVVLSLTVFFKITSVTGEGSLVYSSEEISDACASLYGKNIITVGKQKVLNTVNEKLPFIESIKLKKNPNGSLHIIVTDATEYYCFKENETYYSVSKNNKVLNSYSDVPGGMIFVTATLSKPLSVGNTVEYADQNEKDLLETVLAALTEKEITVNAVDVTNSAAITVNVENRFTVNLGSAVYIGEKAAHLKGMTQSIDISRKGSINLSAYSPENKQGFFTETHNY